MKKAKHARPLVLSVIIATSVAILILVVAGHSALAQMSPFGGLRPPVAGGIGGWLIAKQAIFYRALAGMIRSAKTDGLGCSASRSPTAFSMRPGRATARR